MALVRDYLLDSDGNRVLERGDQAFASGAQAVKQGIECRVRMFLGEYWMDQSVGVPWIQSVLIRNPNVLLVKSEIAKAIVATPDVSSAVSTAFSQDTAARTASATFEAASIYGTITGSVSVP